MVFIHLSLRFGEVFLVGTEFEEAVVEIHDVSERTVVGLQLREVEMVYQVVLINIESLVLIGLFEDFGQADDLSHLAVSPTVNRLFSIADHHAHAVVRQVVVEQGNEVLPLQHRSVLELIDEEMGVTLAELLVDERHGEVAHHVVDSLVEFRDVHHLLLADIVVRLRFDDGPQGIEAEAVELVVIEQIGGDSLLILFQIGQEVFLELLVNLLKSASQFFLQGGCIPVAFSSDEIQLSDPQWFIFLFFEHHQETEERACAFVIEVVFGELVLGDEILAFFDEGL